ncbi:hypothetical protein MSMEI_5218 [Mycolicibacterium smegmatis MC2 155]|uniref:Uncharacterized protein n=1 Tax=Mycolicibacterium smegmatis (strain ATCC 700084 / mc(2)155) TaxID=246196 RepID=I7G7F7_MYCS2|nr:hypothetical protein MSMEI_5218 [Mycolicibacterium smegmatis MC2 155]
MRRNDFGASVVQRPAEVAGVFGVDLLSARRGDRQDLEVDARVVHDAQSLFADRGEFREDAARIGRQRPQLVDEIGGDEVFFEGNQRHGHLFSRHSTALGPGSSWSLDARCGTAG